MDACRYAIRLPSLRAAKTRGTSLPASYASTCPCTRGNAARAKVTSPSAEARCASARKSRSCHVKRRSCRVKPRSCRVKPRSCRAKPRSCCEMRASPAKQIRVTANVVAVVSYIATVVSYIGRGRVTHRRGALALSKRRRQFCARRLRNCSGRPSFRRGRFAIW